jgi:diguanylate cyclase (GGDEF)-like protein/PAS domain S-box-containing protein
VVPPRTVPIRLQRAAVLSPGVSRRPPKREKERAENGMTSVVIVDDQAINLKILGQFARSLAPDIDVHTFDQPARALEFVATNGPDLIVTDYVMPMMDGAEFIRRCRKLDVCRDSPIIVVTAYEDQDFRYRALDLGASDYLLSPVDGREFCARARNLLALWGHQRRLSNRASALENELAVASQHYADEIRQREQQLRRVVDTVPALIRASDAQGHIVLLNSCHHTFFDFDWRDVIGHRKDEVFNRDYGIRHMDLDRRVRESRRTLAGVEETLVDRRGRERVLLTTKAPLIGSDGSVDQVVTVSLDITTRKRSEQAALESEQRFRRLVEGSVLGIVIERDGAPIFANHTYARIFGYESPEEILALPSLDAVFAPEELPRVRRLRQQDDAGSVAAEPNEFRAVRKDGSQLWVQVLTQEVHWQGTPAWQSTVADITLRKGYEERLHRQANYDETTGLPNRVLALDRLRSAVVSAVRHRYRGGLLFIDLDQFKKINDTWGHATGDQLLTMAADRLRGCVRQEDTVARLGGDEFTVILPNIGTPSHTEPVIHKILQAFSQPFNLERHEAFVTASIGVAVFPDDSDDPAILMRHADAAMYRAKEQGRNTFQFFTPELNVRAMERMRIESHLLHAVDRGEFRLHYQPVIDTRSGQPVGAEALLRWCNPDLGTLEPEAFIPLAEDTGLIVPIGRWIVDAACSQLDRWRRHGLHTLVLSVNISSRQLRGRGLLDSLMQGLERYNITPHQLELEITEGCLLHDAAETNAALEAIEKLGLRLALDDFGTGYSSLSHLKEFPVDTVKIDKSFVLNVAKDAGSATVVEAIIAMAHRLGIRVIAEGIETAEQLEFIRSRGCDLAQGFYFSPPLKAEDFETWHSDWIGRFASAVP